MGMTKDDARADGAAGRCDAPTPANRAARRRAVHGHWGIATDGNARARVMARAWALRRSTEAGRHYGPVTGKTYDVLRSIERHMDHVTGACFPSHETLGDDADCARSTVQLAIARLRELGLVAWLTRYARKVVEVLDPTTGERTRRVVVVRTSNAYAMLDPRLAGRGRDEVEPWRPVALRPSWRERRVAAVVAGALIPIYGPDRGSPTAPDGR